MKFCGKCGKQLEAEDRFCGGCGSVVQATTDETPSRGDLNSNTKPLIEDVESYSDGPQIIGESNTSADTTQYGEASFESENEYYAAPGHFEQSFNTPPTPVVKPPRSLKIKILLGALLAIVLTAGGFWGWQNFGTEARTQAKLDLAVKYLSENDYEKAVLAFNDAISIDPKEVKAYQGLARTYTLQGKYDDAITTYDRGLTAVAAEKKPLLQIGLAGMYIDQGQLDNAERAFQELINSNQNYLEAYWGLAVVYQQKGDNAKAEATLRKAIENNPKEYRTYNTLALFLKQNNRADEALNNLVQSLTLEINQQEAYLVLTDMYKDRWPNLRSKASGVSNPQVGAMLEFYSYYAAQDYQKAVNIYNERLEQQTGNYKARILAAIAMYKLDDKAAARKIIDKVKKEKLNDWLLSDLANYYLEAGDKERAREYALKALQANGTNLDAIALLQNLNTDNAEVKAYTARALLFNWKPVGLALEDMQARCLPLLGELRNIDEIINKINRSANVKIKVNQIDNQQFPLMKLYVSVLDYNNESIDNIPLDYFIIREKLLSAEKYVTQKAQSVDQLQQNTALSIDLVMDTSASMQENSKLENAKQAAKNFISIVNGCDELGILEFNSYVRTKSDFTTNTNNLISAISQLYTSGQTALYDAMYTSLVRTSQKQGAKCVIVFTDGQSNQGTKTKQDVIDLAKKTGIPIYTIGIGNDVHTGILKEIATQTGGYYVSTPTAADLENIYQSIFREQKKQYLITYESNNNVQTDLWRNIQLALYSKDYAGISTKEYTSEIVKPPMAALDMVQIDQIIKTNVGSGDYSIVIKDLSNGEQYKTGQYNKQMPASALINIPITLAIADMIKDGSVTLNTKIPFHYTVGGRIKITEDNDGQLYTIGELLKTMLHYSDNNCTNTLLNYIGIDKVNSIANKYGCSETFIKHTLLGEDASVENLITCENVGIMLELLYSDSLPIGSAYMNDNFKIVDETKKVGILKYLPESIFALHHNAMTSTKYNETAYIGNGSKKYIMTVLSCNGKQQELEEATAQISKYVYDQMAK